VRLAARGVAKRFGATVALDGVDLALAGGEVHALLGENGAGKSTLMRVLSGALAPDAGTLALDGAPFRPRSPADARDAGVAMVFQELSIAPHLTVAENVVLGDEPGAGPWLDRRAVRARARAALAAVGRADLAVDARAGELPLAARQMVEIARAIARSAKVLVLDEPASSLGRADAEHLFAAVRAATARGLAVVHVTHRLEEVFAHAAACTVLRDGRVAWTGRLAGIDADRLIEAMAGERPHAPPAVAPREPGERLLSLAGLAGERLPVDASLEVRRGEVVGIAGLIGAGRTELLRAVFGLDPIARGEVRALGAEGPRSPRERWRGGVGMTSEDREGEGLALGRSVAENLCLPRLDRVGGRGGLSAAALRRAAEPWIERLGVRCASTDAPAGSLSGGNQQKLALARLFFADVDLFLLDEPTRGVDVAARTRIHGLIRDLVRPVGEGGRARGVLVVSSHLPELLELCDRVAVLRDGRLGPARDARSTDATRLLREALGRGGGA